MKDVQYGNTHYDELKVVGEHMLIEKLEQEDLRKSGGIYLPAKSKKDENLKIGVARILEIGDAVYEKYGVNAGDYILYDYYAASHDIGRQVVLHAENIILIVDEAQAKEFLVN